MTQKLPFVHYKFTSCPQLTGGTIPTGLVPTLLAFLASPSLKYSASAPAHELQVLVQKPWKGTYEGHLWAFTLFQLRKR